MEEQTKQAFSNFARSHDGQVILEYYEKVLRELIDIRNADIDTFVSRKISADFIENEIINKIKSFNKRHGEFEEDY